jgi:flavin-dependent dehydrogenase
MEADARYDVVILGAGLAGLSLARQLLLESDRTVLLLERRPEVPTDRQKVGESLVQLSGYYFSKVLDLEEYLLREHYLKYNLRFYWPSGSTDAERGARFEDYSQSYIRGFSNVVSYQLNRNTIEGELLRRNLEDPRFTFTAGVKGLEVELTEGDPAGERPHRVAFEAGGERREVEAGWVVDTTGRGRFLAKKRGLLKPNPIRHGTFFWWVDGLVNIEKLTDSSPREVRLNPARRATGHAPYWLATNHFCGEGYWFWVIPLQGKTSLGLVFDNRLIDPSDVFSVEKATEWVCRRHPLFARDLPHRKVLDFAGFRDYSYDCVQTISADRWALAGEAGRFTDPLYSPGSDLIAIYNSLIIAAIETADPEELGSRCRIAEQIMRAVYSAYVPSYAVSYDTLGDQEAFSLKYTWELATYFAAYVFPFINELFTNRRFAPAFLRLFSRLGPVNRSLQPFLSDYYQWKKANRPRPAEPVFFDFSELATLREAEKMFYEVGVTVDEARKLLARQVDNLEELARFIAAHAASVVLGDPAVATDRRFVAGLDPAALVFDPEAFARRWAECRAERRAEGPVAGTAEEPYPWSIDPRVLDRFRSGDAVAAAGPAAPGHEQGDEALAMPAAGAGREELQEVS